MVLFSHTLIGEVDFSWAFVAALFTRLPARLSGRSPGRPRWLGLSLVGTDIAPYTLLVGASASVVRAVLMGGLTLLARRRPGRPARRGNAAGTGGLHTAEDQSERVD